MNQTISISRSNKSHFFAATWAVTSAGEFKLVYVNALA